MDLHKTHAQQRLAEELTDGGLHAEDGLRGGHAQVDDVRVEPRVLGDGDEGLPFRGGGSHVSIRPARVHDVKREGGGPGDGAVVCLDRQCVR